MSYLLGPRSPHLWMNCPGDPLGPLAEDVETKGLRTFEAQRTGAAPWVTTGAKGATERKQQEFIMYHYFKVRGMSRISIFVAVATIYIYTRILYTYIHYIDVGLTKHGRFTSDFRLFFGQDDWDAHGCRFEVRSINSDHFSEKVGNTINGPLKEVFPNWV